MNQFRKWRYSRVWFIWQSTNPCSICQMTMKGDGKEGLDLTMISYFPRGLSAHVIRVFNIKEVIHGESWCPLLKMEVA